MKLAAIAWKELIQLRRDRLTLAMMAALPLVQLLLFGYAINTDVRHAPMVVHDQDRTAASRDLARRFEATGDFQVVGQVAGYGEIERALREGRARIGLVVPDGYSAALAEGRTARAQLIVDGSDPQTVSSATRTASALAQQRSLELMLARSGPGGAVPVSVETNTWYNPELRTPVFIVPGLVGVILTMTMVMLTAMAIARERERGTLEQLVVSPISRVDLIAGKIAPYVLIGYGQMALILGVGYLVFDVPIRGSLPLLFGLSALFIAANLALGLFFSSLARTQQQAMQMSFFFLLPNILLSGFMFPFEAMPEPAQWLAHGLPLTHFMRIVRGVVLKGSTAADLAGELAWLAGILLVLVVLAGARFRKKLD